MEKEIYAVIILVDFQLPIVFTSNWKNHFRNYILKIRGIGLKKKTIFSMLSSTAIFLSLFSANTQHVDAESQTLNDLQRQQQELNQQSNKLKGNIKDAEQEMNTLDSERTQLKNEIAEIQKNIDSVLKEIKAQEEEIARLEEEIKQLNIEIDILKEKIEQRNVALAKQARGVQTSGAPSNIIDIILSADSLTELVGKIEVINLLIQNNNNVMQAQIADRQLVEEKAAQVEATKEEADQVKLAMEVNRNNLVAQRRELDNKVKIVTEKFDLTAEERNGFINQQNSVAQQADRINKLVQEEKGRIAAEKARKAAAEKARKAAAEKARAEAEAAKRKEVSTASASSAANSSGWVKPSNGYVTSKFGMRTHPITGRRRLHGGIDIGGGGSIVAAKSGVVEIATYSSSYGYYVRIDHGGGMKSLYAHMTSNLAVSPGQTVSAGQRIGTMGTTGSSTGVHLHFEIFQNGTKINPNNIIRFY